jgi:3-dehydroquinate synthase
MEFSCRSIHEQTYKVYLDWNIIDRAPEFFKKHDIATALFIISDTNVFKIHGKRFLRALKDYECHTMLVKPAETSKSLLNWKRIQDFLVKKGADRKSTVIAFGGGVVGDLAGFAASTYMRGLGFVQVPTTILSQSDSSIGAKVAVNHPLAKNLIGSFYQPKLILTDPSLLTTLPAREFSAGLGEAIKYGVIADPDLFELLHEKMEQILAHDRELLNDIIARCISIKIGVVEQDERESGLRKILNFGHTIGHALEQVTGYKKLRHGEAVSWGMLAAGWIAIQRGMWSPKEFVRLQSIITRAKCLYPPGKINPNRILEALKHDKKKSGKSLQFVLPERTGKVTIVKDIDPETVKEAVRMMFKLGSSEARPSHPTTAKPGLGRK